MKIQARCCEGATVETTKRNEPSKEEMNKEHAMEDGQGKGLPVLIKREELLLKRWEILYRRRSRRPPKRGHV